MHLKCRPRHQLAAKTVLLIGISTLKEKSTYSLDFLVAVTISEACRSAFDADSNSSIDFQKMQVKLSCIGAYDRMSICDSDLECR
jgi:hypothetical protein